MNNDYIELLIKVPKEIYKHTQEYEVGGFNTENGDKLFMVIKNGTPLPKGHGRLIDADELEECKEIMNTISGESKYVVRMGDIRDMPTIIEADKEGAEK